MEKVFVDKIVVDSLAPTKVEKKFEHLLPKNLIHEKISFEIHGVSAAIANAIRRTIMSEMDVKHLFAEISSVMTNEPFIIHEMVTKRIKSIPVKQSTPMTATFELVAVNDTAVVRDVKTSEIVVKSGPAELPFNETYTLFTLNPGNSIQISPIVMQISQGYIAGNGMCALGVNVVSWPLDQHPIDPYHPELGGIPCSLSNPRVWRITFNTNGSMPPKKIVRAACENILARVNSIKNMLSAITFDGEDYRLIIHGESDTIGYLFARTIHELYPDIKAVVPVPDGRVLTIIVRTTEDINQTYSAAIRYINETFNIIKDYF